ncbi:acyl-CoA dehydrogenase [Mycobacterium intracellulare]|uniref:acyl-CoA dehydrogenase n=1 Tax=Mycobacterium intracellulare TaxID=1767 RepID=UPI00080BED48|nr:acyl-CoA dehydrogenase [Mycobacterium intracellulare]OCB27238.1 acyl-CoA dehydrogenase [Mycobacterium intracellulare subsp. yongonense]
MKSIGLTEELIALAESVSAFARRVAPSQVIRDAIDDPSCGIGKFCWDRVVAQDFHRIHLPSDVGGGGAGLIEAAVVAEQFGRWLFPGPFLPTVIAGAAVAESDRNALTQHLLERLSMGAAAAVVSGRKMTVEVTDGHYRIDGVSDATLGLPDADIVLLETGTNNGDPAPVLIHVPLDREGVSVTPVNGVDLSRTAGRLTCQDYYTPVADQIRCPTTYLDLARNALMAAEAAGVAQWCLDTAVTHVKQREQFGRPVGSFQAVQHKAAMMFIHAQVARAAAWDAARAQRDADIQQRLVTAAVALTSLALAREVAVDMVTLLGGMGFTWEHDAHLYWRKAISLAGAVGARQRWSQDLGQAAMTASREFALIDDTELPELRLHIGETLDRVQDLLSTESDGARAEARIVLADAGLVAPNYARPYGIGADVREQAAIAQEFVRRGIEQPDLGIGEWIVPTILLHGSDAQRSRFVTASLHGAIAWCQLFSEPGAGSDLASLTTSARRVSGGWVISGQKIWTSDAHLAQWGACLARSDPSAPKHRGISYFLIDMATAGVDIRPLRQATGHSDFNEVFLDEVFVPDDCLVGQPGEGWKLATTTLANERLTLGTNVYHGSARMLREAIRHGDVESDSAEALQVLGECTAREMALGALSLRGALERIAGIHSGSTSVQKIFNALTQRRGSADLLDLVGTAGCATGTAVDYATDQLMLPATLTGGGTIEIQLNVVARRLLDLPR